jgi:hypothetical protein
MEPPEIMIGGVPLGRGESPDRAAYVLALNEALAGDSLHRRIIGEARAYRARVEAAERRRARPARRSRAASRRFPSQDGWPAPTGCDCPDCQAMARRGLLGG